jgi:hypothetical protein
MAEASEAAKTALDAAAPAAERFDAQAVVAKSSLADALIPRSDLQPVIDYINGQTGGEDFGKALQNSVVIPFPPKNRGGRGMQSVTLDDFTLVAQGNYWDRPGILGFDAMRAMVEQTPILSAVLQTRIRQVSRFCRVQTGGIGAGFVIQHRDKTIEMTEEHRNTAQLLQEFVTNCGWETDPRKRKRLKRDSFPMFMSKLVRDTLTLDAAPIETEWKRDKSKGLDGFYAVDGATIRLCTEEGYNGDDEIFALQVIQGNIRTAYNYEDLIYEVRNPRTDVLAAGYGFGECEMLIRVVTYLLNTLTFNGSYFDKNSIPRGVMHLSGNYSNEDLAAFKRFWLAMVRGTQNWWNVPILVSKDQESKASFEKFNADLDEMAFSKWITLLTSITCAVYGVSPEEISMESFAASKSSLSGDDTEEKLESGSVRGLHPFLTYFENEFTDFIIRTFSDKYVFRWTGLEDTDPKTREENRKLVLTWNEMRQEEGYDAVPGVIGDVPLNPALIGVWQAVTPEAQPQQPAGDFGNPDDDADAGGGGDEEDFGDPPAEEGEDDFGDAPSEGEDVAKSFGLPDLVFKVEP